MALKTGKGIKVTTVPTISIVFMTISTLVAILVPIILLIVFRRKGGHVKTFFIGCFVFLFFALVLESAVHRLVLGSPTGAVIQGNIWLYALYGGLMTGIFEEMGRFLAFRTVLRKQLDNDAEALMYGAGHGGIESIVLAGLSMILSIVFAVMINTGGMAAWLETMSGDTLTQMQATIDSLVNTTPYMFLLTGVERLSAITVHIALSVLVWFAAKNPKCGGLFPLAILIHAVVDGVTVILSSVGVPTVALEVIIALMAAAVAVFAYRVWKKNAGVPGNSANEEAAV